MKVRLAFVFAAIILVTSTPCIKAENMFGGARVWFAEWDQNGESRGNDPFYVGYLGCKIKDYSIVGQFGYASDGWEYAYRTFDRLDASLFFSRTLGDITIGLGGHLIQFDQNKKDTVEDQSWQYIGPELLLGYSTAMDKRKTTFFSVSGTIGYYLYDYEYSYDDFQQTGIEPIKDERDGSAYGYSADVSLAKQLGTVLLRIGYRYQFIKNQDAGFDWDDEFRGVYLDAGVRF